MRNRSDGFPLDRCDVVAFQIGRSLYVTTMAPEDSGRCDRRSPADLSQKAEHWGDRTALEPFLSGVIDWQSPGLRLLHEATTFAGLGRGAGPSLHTVRLVRRGQGAPSRRLAVLPLIWLFSPGK